MLLFNVLGRILYSHFLLCFKFFCFCPMKIFSLQISKYMYMRFHICKTTPANNKNRMMIWQQLIRMLYSFPSPKTYQGMMRQIYVFSYSTISIEIVSAVAKSQKVAIRLFVQHHRVILVLQLLSSIQTFTKGRAAVNTPWGKISGKRFYMQSGSRMMEAFSNT